MGSTYQSITVNANVHDVWDLLRDFHDVSWAPNVIERCEVVGDAASSEIGAQRVLNDAFHETLQALDDEERLLKYSIDDGPSPVSKDEVNHYIGRVQARPITHGLDGSKGTFVAWSSTWEAKTDEAEDFCQTIYVSLLKALKAHFSEA